MAGALLVLALTAPAAQREPALDDIAHLRIFPAANAGLSWLEVLRLPHWQHIPGEIHWRPLPKLLWRWVGIGPQGGTRHLWLLTGALAGLCAGIFATGLREITRGWKSARVRARGRASVKPPLADLFHFTPAPPHPRTLTLAFACLMPLLNPLSADVLLPLVGQMDLLATAGVLGAWVCWQRGGGLWAAAGLLCLMVGLFSKESAYPAVFALPLALWLGAGSRPIRRRRAAVASALGVLALATRLGLQLALFGRVLSGTDAGQPVAEERAFGALEALGRHAAALLAPTVPQSDYSFLKQPGGTPGLFPALGFLAASLWLAALVWVLRPRRTPTVESRKPIFHGVPRGARGAPVSSLRARRLVAAGLLWIALFLVPYLHIAPLAALWAGRFLFLPLWGAALVALGLSRALPGAWRLLPLVWLGGVTLAGVVALPRRAQDWASERTLWEAEIERRPEHALAWFNLATVLQRQGEVTTALAAARRACALWPSYGEAWLGRAQIAAALGRDGEAGEAFARAEQFVPHLPRLQIERAKFDAAHGRLAEAAARLEALLARDPANAEAQRVLDQVRSDLRRSQASPEFAARE